jgi:tetratricopeptide (TPR) repeat protein
MHLQRWSAEGRGAVPFGTGLLLALVLGAAPVRAEDPSARLAEARREQAAAHEAAPADLGLLLRLARTESDLGLTQGGDTQRRTWAEAVRHAREALRLAPERADASATLALVLQRQARREGPRARLAIAREVRAAAERALELDARSATAWHVLGEWHAQVADINAFERFAASLALGGAPHGGTREAAEQAFHHALEIEPESVWHRLDYARLLRELHRTAAARRELRLAISLPATAPLDAWYQAEARRLLERTKGGRE